MKKISLIILSIFLFFCFTGCSKNSGALAKTPEEEYDRIMNLAGTGVIYNFDELDKIQIKQTVKMASPYLNQQSGGSGTDESIEFKLDRSDRDVGKSQSERKRISSINDDGIQYEEFKTWVAAGKYYSSVETSGSDYGNYDGFIAAYSVIPASATIPDIFFRKNIKLPDRTKYGSISGGKTKTVYTINAEVKEENLGEFYMWFESLCPWLSHKTSSGEFKYYNPSDLTSAKIEVKTSAINLNSLILTMVFTESEDKVLTLIAKTECSLTGFSVSAPKT